MRSTRPGGGHSRAGGAACVPIADFTRPQFSGTGVQDFDAANNPTHPTTPPEETGSQNLYPSLAEMEQEENISLNSDPPPTSDATSPTLQAGQSVVLSTSNPPPYEWKAKCAHCTQEIGSVEGPQYKCSTCPNYLLCDICQDIITAEQNKQYEDNDWDYLLPHTPTHSVYKTEVPDPSSPSVLHTSHPPEGDRFEGFV